MSNYPIFTSLAWTTVSLMPIFINNSVCTKYNRSRYLGYLMKIISVGNAYLIFIFSLFETNIITSFPNLYFTLPIFTNLLPSLLYLFVKENLYGNGFRYKDLLHAIPSMLFAIDQIPFYLITKELKQLHFTATAIESTETSIARGWLFTNRYNEVIEILLYLWYGYLILQEIRNQIKTKNTMNFVLKVYKFWGYLLLLAGTILLQILIHPISLDLYLLFILEITFFKHYIC